MALSIIVSLGVLYVALVLLLYVFQHKLLYFPEYPTRRLTSTPEQVGLTYESVTLMTEDSVALHGWFVPAQNACGTVLFFHGNAGNISHRLSSIRLLHELALNVFVIDYRGYGESKGVPSEKGTYCDAEAAWRYLAETRGIAAEHIVFFGRSLGAAIAAWLAQKHTPRALILESCFTSIPDIAAKLYPYFPVRLLSRFFYPAYEYIEHVRCPVLVVHSHDDEIVPFQHGIQMYERAHEPKEFLEMRGTHNERSLQLGSDYAEGIKSFVSRFVVASLNKTL